MGSDAICAPYKRLGHALGEMIDAEVTNIRYINTQLCIGAIAKPSSAVRNPTLNESSHQITNPQATSLRALDNQRHPI